MGISVRTVEGHRRRVLSKLHVTSAAQLVRVVMDARQPLEEHRLGDARLVATGLLGAARAAEDGAAETGGADADAQHVAARQPLAEDVQRPRGRR